MFSRVTRTALRSIRSRPAIPVYVYGQIYRTFSETKSTNTSVENEPKSFPEKLTEDQTSTNHDSKTQDTKSENQAGGDNSHQSNKDNHQYSYWFLRRGLRSVQVMVLAAGIFTTGSSYGTMKYANDPKEMQEHLLKETIVSVSSYKDLKDSYYDINTIEYKRVSKVGDRVLKAARAYITHKIKLHQQILYDKMCLYQMNKSQFEDAAQDLLFWEKAYSRLDGDWKYIVIKEKDKVNAFTTEACPRHLFILEGFLTKLNPSDDELALVLAHEISHIIYNHSSQQIIVKALVASLQLLILTFIDPTGFSSFFLEGLSYMTTFAVSRSHDRKCETDADDLGVKLTSAACYDVSKGINFYLKLANEEGFKDTQWHHTHPSSADRHSRLAEQLKVNQVQQGYKLCQRYRADLLYSIQHRRGKGEKEVFEWLGIDAKL